MALLLVLIVSFAGCARPAATPAPTPTAKPTATSVPAPTPAGPYGELRIGIATFGKETFDPVRSSSTDTLQFLGPMNESLLRSDGAKLLPGVADSWELAPDGGSWIFRIHKGIKFHNGDDLTAADVKFSLERLTSPATFDPTLRGAVDRVEQIDQHTVRVFTKGPQPYLPVYLAYYTPAAGYVLPKNYVEQNSMPYFEQHPMGSGPFKFVRHTGGDSVEYEALDKHWRQVPSFKKLVNILLPEEATRLAALRTGALDIAEASLEIVPDLERAGLRTANVAFAMGVVLLSGAYVPESAGLPVADIKVRQALSLAVDRDEIIKSFFRGKAVKALPGFLTQACQDVDIPYWYDLGDKVYNRYDPQEASRLLKEAGYPERFASPAIQLWNYSMAGASFLPKMAEVVASYWQKVGVKVELRPSDQAAVQAVRNTLKVPALRGVTRTMKVSARPSPPQILDVYVSGRAAAHVLLGEKFPEVDALLQSSAREMDPAKRKEMLAKVVKTVSDAYVVVAVADVPALAGLGPNVDFPTISGFPELPAYAEYVKHKGQ
ncbi:MAG: ABC transporter substrate-binding protein [Chloroflexi bacterium]|nr:ABC transporter substrate-binding protein [Chloroflexota bacterium]